MRFDVFYDVPSTFDSILKFYLNIFVFAILTWYFDHVDSSNRGKSYGYFFFFEKNYWCSGEKNNKPNKENDRLLSQTLQQKQKLLDKSKSFMSCNYLIHI
jgi:hypothetical protein